MPDPTHPGQLDRMTSSGASKTETVQASPAEVAVALKKVLVTGALRRIPKHPVHRDIVLALLCLDLQRRYAYKEIELNRYLATALQAMNALVDHVTCRRYLVDLGFLRRDRAGTRYFVNPLRVESTLSPSAVNAATALLAEVLGRGVSPR
jgi:hypothetical protein